MVLQSDKGVHLIATSIFRLQFKKTGIVELSIDHDLIDLKELNEVINCARQELE